MVGVDNSQTFSSCWRSMELAPRFSFPLGLSLLYCKHYYHHHYHCHRHRRHAAAVHMTTTTTTPAASARTMTTLATVKITIRSSIPRRASILGILLWLLLLLCLTPTTIGFISPVQMATKESNHESLVWQH